MNLIKPIRKMNMLNAHQDLESNSTKILGKLIDRAPMFFTNATMEALKSKGLPLHVILSYFTGTVQSDDAMQIEDDMVEALTHRYKHSNAGAVRSRFRSLREQSYVLGQTL